MVAKTAIKWLSNINIFVVGVVRFSSNISHFVAAEVSIFLQGWLRLRSTSFRMFRTSHPLTLSLITHSLTISLH
jgi:hypothetical protein